MECRHHPLPLPDPALPRGRRVMHWLDGVTEQPARVDAW